PPFRFATSCCRGITSSEGRLSGERDSRRESCSRFRCPKVRAGRMNARSAIMILLGTMRTALHKAVVACALITLLALTAGCGRSEGIVLSTWTVDAPGLASSQVTLPRHLDVPDVPTRYTLRTTVDLDRSWRGRELWLVLPLSGGPTTLRAGGATIEPRE